MAHLTRETILNISDIKTEEVEVPEWGGSVVVKGMTGYERDNFEASIVEMRKGGNKVHMDNIRAKLVSRTVIDPDTGDRMFSSADIELLGSKSAAALDRIFSVAQRMSKLSDEDIQELEKN